MTLIDAAVIGTLVAALAVGFYLVWFLAHPRSPERAREEAERMARGRRSPDGEATEPLEEEPAGAPRLRRGGPPGTGAGPRGPRRTPSRGRGRGAVTGRARGRRPRAGLSEGTRLVLAGLALYVAVAVVVWLFPALRFTPARPLWAGAAGWVLLLLSLAAWFVAARSMRASYAAGQFPVDGLFAWVRHPVYAAFVFVQCPGLVLWLWGWPALVLPFAAYALCHAALRREEQRLYDHFGPPYEAYRRRVPALFPWPRRRPQPPPGAGGELVNRKVAARKAAAARSAARRGGKDREDSHLRGL